MTICAKSAGGVHRLPVFFFFDCPPPCLISHRRETKMLPHIRFKRHRSVRSFTNFVTRSVRHFGSTTRSVQASGVQRMMGTHAPDFPPLCFTAAKQIWKFLLSGTHRLKIIRLGNGNGARLSVCTALSVMDFF